MTDFRPWRVAGHYFESCNCEAICPCRMVAGVPGGRSTYGECLGALSWAIADGRAADLDLSGLNVALLYRYHDDEPGSPWTLALHVDERGGDEQRAALEEIFLGRAGGPGILALPWVRKASDLVGVRVGPIEIEHDRGDHRLRVGVSASVRASRPVVEQDRVACIVPGYERVGTELYADELVVEEAPFSFRYEGNCAFAADFEYRSDP